MMKDTNWLLSPSFLVCAEHAEHISRTIDGAVQTCTIDFAPPHISLCNLKGTGELENDLRRRVMVYADCLDRIDARWKRNLINYSQYLRGAVGMVYGEDNPVGGGHWDSGGRGLYSAAEAMQDKLEKEPAPTTNLSPSGSDSVYASGLEVAKDGLLNNLDLFLTSLF
ncbi:hypothetical protein M427DRAFT_312925 [Gonapodya prolifera JEL478]|uniref:Uncharacterized protein n=1 Tax=Gonapodya prolifera (strain JEL478) TaxID=1344416 RepID=A0A139AWU5_GONPJ|nr:hypothetical protein M427DRAFT_312925 [Gonapodya prolifera JEL478]|eukprot:KXS21174.1 hypothetical protein M427DRAFT_312925 [Gonapodya prolifera JEL478]